jgi:hypothetical protein
MDFDLNNIFIIAEHGLALAVKQGSVIFVEHGYCWHCNSEKSVYEASPDWPVQPPRCFDCYATAIKTIFDDPKQLEDLIQSVEDRSVNDSE